MIEDIDVDTPLPLLITFSRRAQATRHTSRQSLHFNRVHIKNLRRGNNYYSIDTSLSDILTMGKKRPAASGREEPAKRVKQNGSDSKRKASADPKKQKTSLVLDSIPSTTIPITNHSLSHSILAQIGMLLSSRLFSLHTTTPRHLVNPSSKHCSNMQPHCSRLKMLATPPPTFRRPRRTNS